ncbi:MAG: DinB family protein [Actinomycetota bacterium]|nr:DinB family protein [Actinomycetota bacterium]
MTTATTTATEAQADPTGERADLLQTLAQHRHFLRYTVRGLSDEQAGQRTTASALCLGGLIKHVARAESNWVDFIVGGADAMAEGPKEWTAEKTAERWMADFGMLPGETLAGILERYDEVARRTDQVVAALADLDASQALPVAPWFPPGARWTARRALLHIIAETSQHAGHADIIRESLDGAKTMG